MTIRKEAVALALQIGPCSRCGANGSHGYFLDADDPGPAKVGCDNHRLWAKGDRVPPDGFERVAE